jgi:hypothetical protein
VGYLGQKQCQKPVFFGDLFVKFAPKKAFLKGDSGELVRILWMVSRAAESEEGGIGRRVPSVKSNS